MMFTILGNRVLLKVLNADEAVGGILVPTNLPRQYVKAEVIAVGDGKMRGIDRAITRKIGVKLGDHVFVQLNPLMATNNLQKVAGERYLSLDYNDVIARLTCGVMALTLDSFDPVGQWVLLRGVAPKMAGVLYLPETSGGKAIDNPGEIRWYLAKLGELAAAELPALAPGTRVLPEHVKANLLKIDGKVYAYINVCNVVGFTDEVSQQDD
jgi:co-chaperonin GroES (HSP10)